MLDKFKYFMKLKSVDKNILENNFELALEKLNFLIKEDFKPSETYFKRGRLCRKLLMYDDAYSDFTYIINHCSQKKEALRERLLLNYEMGNYYEAIVDSNAILNSEPENFDVKRVKFLSFIFLEQNERALKFIYELFDFNKFKILHFLFKEVALFLSKDEYSRGLLILNFIDLIDNDNPIKMLKEANIYALAGDKDKQTKILENINTVFPKYFVSHFNFYDMYQDKDLLEVNFLLELEIFDKQGLFLYPFRILEGYKCHLEGRIIDSKEAFEKAIRINPTKPEAYVLLAQTLQLMSGYDNPEYKLEAEENYKKAMKIYQQENLLEKAEEMKRQIKHLNSTLSFR